jgi:DNA topoisomerase-3
VRATKRLADSRVRQRGIKRSQATAPTKRPRKRKAEPIKAPPDADNRGTGTRLRIPYGNKEIAMKLGARYGATGWYAPPGVDLSAFDERGWL